jgi:hypothetical protein
MPHQDSKEVEKREGPSAAVDEPRHVSPGDGEHGLPALGERHQDPGYLLQYSDSDPVQIAGLWDVDVDPSEAVLWTYLPVTFPDGFTLDFPYPDPALL